MYEERLQALREEYEAQLVLVRLHAEATGMEVGMEVGEAGGRDARGEIMKITGIEDIGVQTER